MTKKYICSGFLSASKLSLYFAPRFSTSTFQICRESAKIRILALYEIGIKFLLHFELMRKRKYRFLLKYSNVLRRNNNMLQRSNFIAL